MNFRLVLCEIEINPQRSGSRQLGAFAGENHSDLRCSGLMCANDLTIQNRQRRQGPLAGRVVSDQQGGATHDNFLRNKQFACDEGKGIVSRQAGVTLGLYVK